MQSEHEEDATLYRVVRNHEDQYSIWRDGAAIPAGWNAVGDARTRAQCLGAIEELWVDMRPLSLRY